MNDQQRKEYKDRIQDLINALSDFKKRNLTDKTQISKAEFEGVLGQDIQDTVFWVIKEGNLPRFPQYEDLTREEFEKLSIDDEILVLQEVIREELATDIPANLPAMLEALHEREMLVEDMKAKRASRIQVIDPSWEERFRRMVANLEVENITSEILPEVIPLGVLSEKRSDEIRREIQKDTEAWEVNLAKVLQEKEKIDEAKARTIVRSYINDYVVPSKKGERISPINPAIVKTEASLPKILIHKAEEGVKLAAIPLVIIEPERKATIAREAKQSPQTVQTEIAAKIREQVSEAGQILTAQSEAKIQSAAKEITEKIAKGDVNVPAKLDFQKLDTFIKSEETFNISNVVITEPEAKPQASTSTTVYVNKPEEAKENAQAITIASPKESPDIIRLAHRDPNQLKDNIAAVLESRAKNGSDRELSQDEQRQINAIATEYTQKIQALKVGDALPPIEIAEPVRIKEENTAATIQPAMLDAVQSAAIIQEAKSNPDKLEKETAIRLENQFRQETGIEPTPEKIKEIRETAREYVKTAEALKTGDQVQQIVSEPKNERVTHELETIAEVIALPMAFASGPGARQLIRESKEKPRELEERLTKTISQGIVSGPNQILSDKDKSWIAKQTELYVITVQGLDESTKIIPIIDLNKMQPVMGQSVELTDITTDFSTNNSAPSEEVLSSALPIIFIIDKSADPITLSQVKESLNEKYGPQNAEILLPGVPLGISEIPASISGEYSANESFYLPVAAALGAAELAKSGNPEIAVANNLYLVHGVGEKEFNKLIAESGLNSQQVYLVRDHLNTLEKSFPGYKPSIGQLSALIIGEANRAEISTGQIQQIFQGGDVYQNYVQQVGPAGGGISSAVFNLGQRFFGKRASGFLDGQIRKGLSKYGERIEGAVVKKIAGSAFGKILGTIGAAVGVVGGVIGKAVSAIGGWVLSKAQIGIKTNIGKVLGGAGLVLGFIVGGPIGAIVGGILGAGTAGINWKKVGKLIIAFIAAILVSIFSAVIIPLGIAFIAVPLFVVLIIFIINSGAYVVPGSSGGLPGGGSVSGPTPEWNCPKQSIPKPTNVRVLYSSDKQYAFPLSQNNATSYACYHWDGGLATDIFTSGPGGETRGVQDPVVAYRSGTIDTISTTDSLGGKYVILNAGKPDVNGNQYYYYAHLCGVYVNKGDTVNAGDVLATSDNTGNAEDTPEHLHFAMSNTNTFYTGGTFCPQIDFETHFGTGRCNINTACIRGAQPLK